jgi:methylmalonyl-CoA mutase, C-terminal domain
VKALVAILGLDSHWRGAVAVARAMREAGVEVVYLGNQFPEELAAAAAQEDPRLIALSSFSGSHATLFPELMQELRAQGAAEVRVIIGGAIPPADVPALRAAGAAEVFPPGRPLTELLAFIEDLGQDGERAPTH